ncbi:solute carrier family 22 member 7-like [Amblyomma americanum]
MAKKNRKRSSADKPDRQITALTESGTVTAVEPPTGPVESATTAVGASSVTSPLSPEVKADVFSLTSPLSPEGRPGSNPVAPQTATAVATGSVAFDATVSPMDHILIFGHGVFQRLILLCTLLSVFCTILHAEASSNLARPVDHWCRPPAAYANLPPETWKNASIPVELDGSYSGCFRYEPPFVPQSTNSSRDSRETVPCDAGWDYAASTRVSIVGEWNLVCDRRWLMSVLTACYMAGSLLIMPFVGTAADRLGRRPVLGFSLSILIVSGILLAFSSTLFMFASLRFFISASAGSLVVISIVQLFEVTDSSRRVLYCSIAVTGGFSAAHVYGELVYDWVYDWSLIQLFCMVPTGLLIGAVYFVEESPCWLLATFRIKRAAEVVMSAARMNGADMLLVGKRLEVIRQEARKARAEATMTTGEGMLEASPAELFTNRALRNETLVIYGCWFLANSFSYRLRASREDRVVYRALVALAIPTVAANVFLLSTKGRRLSTALSLVLLGSVMASLAGVSFFVPGSGDILSSRLMTAVLVAELLAVDLAVISLYVITVEMYPTVLKGCGISLGYMCGRLGATLAPFVETIESSSVRGTVLAVASLLLVAFGALAWVVLPETTKVHAMNTFRDRVDEDADKWMLKTPLKIARRHSRARSIHERRRSSSCSESRLSRCSRLSRASQ